VCPPNRGERSTRMTGCEWVYFFKY